MTESDVPGMISTEACAAHGHAMTIAFATRQIENVAHNHVFVGVMRAHAVGRVNRFVVKTFEIDRVRAINRNLAGIDISSDRANEAEVLVLVITTERSRKQDEGQAAAVAEREHLKLPTQIRRVPFNAALVHFRAGRLSELPRLW